MARRTDTATHHRIPCKAALRLAGPLTTSPIDQSDVCRWINRMSALAFHARDQRPLAAAGRVICQPRSPTPLVVALRDQQRPLAAACRVTSQPRPPTPSAVALRDQQRPLAAAGRITSQPRPPTPSAVALRDQQRPLAAAGRITSQPRPPTPSAVALRDQQRPLVAACELLASPALRPLQSSPSAITRGPLRGFLLFGSFITSSS